MLKTSLISAATIQFQAEISFKPDFSENAAEWRSLLKRTAPQETTSLDDVETLAASQDAEKVPFSLRAVANERFIGIDQGLRNFAIVVMDCRKSQLPRVIGAELYDLSELWFELQVEIFSERFGVAAPT